VTPRRRDRRSRAPRKPPPAPASPPADRWLQPRLFEAGKDFTRFDEDNDAGLHNPWLLWAIYLAGRRGEARGWKRGILLGTRRALIIVLSGHAAGDTVCYSGIFPALRALGISTERVAEVLEEMGVLADDRRPSFEGWLERKLEGLAEGIGREAGSWLRTMRDGGPRSRARSLETVWRHMNNVRPVLLDWSQRYDHLREVTRDDIQAILGGLHGTRRSSFLVSLRSLFAFCKKKGIVFRNPASGIKVGQHPKCPTCCCTNSGSTPSSIRCDTYECRRQCTDSSAGRPASARNCANRSSTWRAEIRAARSVIQIAG
jgi:hypothetical protein